MTRILVNRSITLVSTILFCLPLGKPCEAQLRVFIYNKDKTGQPRNFEKAVEHQIKQDGGRDQNTLVFEIPNNESGKHEFLKFWKSIDETARARSMTVDSLHLFAHTTLQADFRDGLEFVSGTLVRSEMKNLEVLPWTKSEKVQLHLNTCNSAAMEGWGFRNGKLPSYVVRNWSPTELLAQTQGVTARGQNGYAVFSQSPDIYIEADRYSGDKVYLNAYERGSNNPLWHFLMYVSNVQSGPVGIVASAHRIEPVEFQPYLRDSVGIDGKNLKEDVRFVQRILNQVAVEHGGAGGALDITGAINVKTINAVKKFQRNQLGYSDGLVSARGKTLLSLIEYRNSLRFDKSHIDPFARVKISKAKWVNGWKSITASVPQTTPLATGKQSGDFNPIKNSNLQLKNNIGANTQRSRLKQHKNLKAEEQNRQHRYRNAKLRRVEEQKIKALHQKKEREKRERAEKVDRARKHQARMERLRQQLRQREMMQRQREMMQRQLESQERRMREKSQELQRLLEELRNVPPSPNYEPSQRPTPVVPPRIS